MQRRWLCAVLFSSACSATSPLYETPAGETRAMYREPPRDQALDALRELSTTPLLDQGVCTLPFTAPTPQRNPAEIPVYEELRALLARAPRLYHFGGRSGELCHLECGTERLVCGAEALQAFRTRWNQRTQWSDPTVVSRFSGRTIVGVFEDYWHVLPDGSAVRYHHARTDVAPSRCLRCGWNRVSIANFIRSDGVPLLNAEN